MEINRTYPCNLANYGKGRTQPVRYLVIHYVGATGGARDNAYYYHSCRVEASAHYFVGHGSEGAAVYASVPEGDTAWHCGRADGNYVHPECRNANSIGIELCCHRDKAGAWYFDAQTVDKAVALALDIMARYGIPVGRVVRHYDVTGKRCPGPWVDDPAAWAAFKARLEGENDMTKKEVQALIEAAKPQVYTDVSQVPKWAQGLVRRAVEGGIIKGDGSGRLNLTDQDLKTLSMLDSAGVLKGGGA